MKFNLVLLLFIVLLGCSGESLQDMEEPGSVSEEQPDGSQGSNSETYDLNNIVNLTIEIIAPDEYRDPTYHQLGSRGIFQDPDSTLNFKALVQLDYVNPGKPIDPEKIKIEWRSDKGGLLYEEVLNTSLESGFTTSLSKEYHTITAEARITEGKEINSLDSIHVSNTNGLKLIPTEKSLIFDWTKYVGEDFESYLIYGESTSPLAEITDINQTSYEAFNLRVGMLFDFQVVVKTKTEIQGQVRGSNIVRGAPGNFIILNDLFVRKMIYDQNRQKIYAIVTNTHLDGKGYGLLILDDSGEELKLESHLIKGTIFNDFDISLDGKYLFLCEWGNERITRIELNTYDIETFYIETSGWTMRNIEVGPGYQLYCSRGRLYQEWYALYIVDGMNGDILSPESAALVYGDIDYNESDNKIYHGTSFNEKSIMQIGLDQGYPVRENIFSPNISWPEPFVLVSSDGNHIFWDHFQLDRNLNVERELENVLASSPDSKYLSSESKIMRLEDGSTVYDLPPLIPHKNRFDVFSDRNILIMGLSGEHYYIVNQNHTVVLKLTPE
jgi:hypothetical protein